MAGIKLKVHPQFPSMVQVTSPLTLSKIDGNFTFGLDLAALTASLVPIFAGTYVPLAGGTMTGPLILNANPTAPLGAVTKQYADALTANLVAVPLPSGRLSLSSTSAKPLTDITGASAATLWYVDCGGGAVPIWDTASASFKARPFTGALQLALDSNAGHFNYHAAGAVFDVYAYWDSALSQVRLGTTGSAALDFSNRGVSITGPTQSRGIWVNSIPSYLRVTNGGGGAGSADAPLFAANETTYLGSIATVAAGQSEDSKVRRFIYNAYNPVERFGYKKFTGAAYVYSTAAFRQVNNDASMKVAILLGLPGAKVKARANHFCQCSVAPAIFYTSIGNGSLSQFTDVLDAVGGTYGRALDTVGGWPSIFDLTHEPTIGLKEYWWLEYGPGGATVGTWFPADINFHNILLVETSM